MVLGSDSKIVGANGEVDDWDEKYFPVSGEWATVPDDEIPFV